MLIKVFDNKPMKDFENMSRDQRIKYRRMQLKLSPSYVAKYVGVSRVAYVYWEDGAVNDISWNKYSKLAEVLLTTPQWLEHGKSNEMYICNDANGDITKNLSGVHIVKSNSIPILGDVGKKIKDANKSSEYVDMPAKNGSMLALRLKKDSEICRAHIGDALILDPDAEKLPGEEVYVTFKNGDAIVCSFNYLNDNELNCTTEDGKEIYQAQDIDSIYPVIAVARNGYIKKGSK